MGPSDIQFVNFGWADKCEIKWIESQQQVLASVVRELHGLEGSRFVAPDVALERRGEFHAGGFHCS
jgi:hypothetical protein